MTPKISLAIIVKNESESLKRCIASVAAYVDEVIVVVNKPAQPKLREMIEQGFWVGNDTEKEKRKLVPKLYERKWNHNFAAARNYSFDKCTNDIILWLDADDTVTHPELIPEFAAKIAVGEADWVDWEYLYEFDAQGRVLMRHYKPRLMRKGSGNWVGRVHETFISTEPVKTIRSDEIKTVHHQAEGHHDQSGARNLEILLKEYNENQDATDPRSLYYLANTLMGMGKIEEAIPFYSMHIARCGWPEEKFFSMHYLGHCLSWVGKHEEAINVGLDSLKLFPDWSLAYFDIAEYYSFKTQKDWWKVIEWTLTGLEKDRPEPSVYFTNDLDYDVNPYGRLVDAYLQVHAFDKAYELAGDLYKKWPNDPTIKEMWDDCQKIQKGESFVKAFLTIAGEIRNKDRLKAVKLFDCLPIGMDADIRIQDARKFIVPPKQWEKGSIVIYSHAGAEEWAYPSLFSGIGGSEEAIINMSMQLTKLGYKVTVYCRCGSMAGTYKGVEYVPYYNFNPNDIFDTLVIWRYPGFYNGDINVTARRKLLWLHDIVYPEIFNDRIIENVDKILFLSKWHRNNAPAVPEEKICYTNNGIDPAMFVDTKPKKPNSFVWTSSYDRGLVCLARDILPLIEKEIPDVTLDVAYGTGNLEKEMDFLPHLREIFDECQKIFQKPNVIHHGRISQQKVVDLQKEALIHAYASEFGETNNISAQKAQAAGAYVITTSQSGGTPERVRFGKVIEGNGIYTDKKLQQAYADAVISFLKNPELLTEEKRQAIINEFKWESTARQWDMELLDERTNA